MSRKDAILINGRPTEVACEKAGAIAYLMKLRALELACFVRLSRPPWIPGLIAKYDVT